MIKRTSRMLALTLAAAAVAAAQLRVDSQRGERLFQTESCVECHSIEGKGGKTAPDLGKRIDRNYTPALLASVMWNHAPAMWSAIREKGLQRSALDEQAAADLFAYFYAARFFDKPGDAARGKRAFEQKHCSECHGLGSSILSGAPPVAQWSSLGHPILLAEAMWNHAANMRQRFAERGIAWPEITGQDLTDLLVYLRNLPAARQVPARLDTESGDGQALFATKGCADCHRGKLELEPRLRGKALTDIAAEMWNHAPKMRQPPPPLLGGEMRQIVTYLWTQQIFQETGDPSAGKKVFAAKNCANCHNDRSTGAPDLSTRRGKFSSVSMISTLWRHGPQMLDQMKMKNMPWPNFSSRQMSNLISYLNRGETQ
jgi:mono/diheme cytochrome c family protein